MLFYCYSYYRVVSMTLEKLSLASITVSTGVIVFTLLYWIVSPLIAVTLSLVIARLCEEIIYVSS